MEIKSTGFALVGITAFTSVTIVPAVLAYAVGFIVFLFAIVYFSKFGFVDKKLFIFLLFFLITFEIGLIGLPISYFSDRDRFNYDELSIFGRIFNFIFISSIILFYDKFSSTRDVSLLFRFYMVGIFILIITAIWQSLAVYFSLIPFPFDTRSHVHGASESLNIGSRITGIAREPSYFVMFLVDYIALALLLKNGIRKVMCIALSILLLILSLSPSGVLTVGLAFGASYFFTQLKFYNELGLTRIFIFIAIIALLISFYFGVKDTQFFSYLLHRVSDVDPQESDRLFMLIMPFEWIKDSNALNVLFGHGIKTYSILGSAYLLPDGAPVHVTSNNVFIDVFWESGLLGLLFLVCFFAFIFLKIMKSRFTRKQTFVSLFVFFDLCISSMFRADFASFRFFIMLYLLFLLVNYDFRILRKRNERNKDFTAELYADRRHKSITRSKEA